MREPDPDLAELLARCASEAIHNPGAVQPHGALVVVDGSGTVRAASANLGDITGTSAADVLDQPLEAALGRRWVAALADGPGADRRIIDHGGRRLTSTAHPAGDLVIVEVEADQDARPDDGWRLTQTMQGLMGAPTSEVLVDQVVATVAELTGFDRVMCYRFDADWHGEVISEHVAPDVESFDGLRFPATDIPPQARAQYERTPLRLIPDSHAEPSPILAVGSLSPADLDLSDARLRAVSPIHLRYLRNMGVRSSMSVSLTVDGRLWGIVACHHVRAPLRPPQHVRTVIDLVAQTASMLLTVLEAGRATEQRLGLLHGLDELVGRLARADDQPPIETLAQHGEDLVKLVGATGATLAAGSWEHHVGAVPPAEIASALAAQSRASGGPVQTDELRTIEPAWEAHARTAAGAISVTFGAASEQSITWYRPEVVRTVRWAGDPTTKPVESGADGTPRLGPRASFASYAEVVQGRSEPWSVHEVEIAAELASRLADAEVIQAQRDARLAAQLQQTLLLESFPEISGVVGAAEYRPASHSPLGGDWYDVFYLPSGGSIVALGDVAGHGLDVAATMAQLRHALRAYLVRAPSPAVALSRLNHLTRSLLPTEMATVVLAELDPAGRTIRFANAGHLPPVIAGPGGSRLAGPLGVALGITTTAEYDLVEERVLPGERLFLYSDGLIERRTRSLDEGVALLADEAVATSSLPIDEQCAALVERLTAGSDVPDDVTLVVVEILDEPPG